DPDASGALTIDAVANGSSLDTSSAAFKQAVSACKDLEPSGFTGHQRSPQEQKAALEFAQCIRDNGVGDFPAPRRIVWVTSGRFSSVRGFLLVDDGSLGCAIWS